MFLWNVPELDVAAFLLHLVTLKKRWLDILDILLDRTCTDSVWKNYLMNIMDIMTL